MTFNLTRQQLEERRAALYKQGVDLEGDAGKFTDKDVTIQFSYGEPTLVVTVLSYGGHPSFIVNHIISNWFKR